MKRRKKQKNIKIIFLTAAATILFMLGIFFVYQHLIGPKASTKVGIRKSNLQTIYPTLYVTGSSGSPVENMGVLIKDIASADNNPAKAGLTMIANASNNYKLTITGKIEAGNLYPMIALGTTKGTNNHEIYQYAIKSAMEYLESHYNVPWCNLLGYSSGGGGVMYYLVNYSKDKSFPQVKKFIALDGEFNQEIKLESEETMTEVYKNGPKNKSSDYLYFVKNYQKINKHIQVALMGLNQNNSASDGTLPWADLFSVYNLFEKNGNSVERFTYVSNNKKNNSHGRAWNIPAAQTYIEKFFYQ